jgi:FkbM family methyltransferase
MNTSSILASLLRKVGLYRQVSIRRNAWLARQHNMSLSVSDEVLNINNGNRRICISARDPAYAGDMIKWFEYYHSAVKAVQADGFSVVDYSAPRLHCLSKSGVEFTFPSLPESDDSLQEYVTALSVKAGDTVLDLGAYAGASTYFLSKIVGPDGLVVALEPDETNFRYLEENVKRHALKNVRCVPSGVWDRKENVHFQMEGNMGSGVTSLLGRNSNSKMASMITLEDAAEIAGGRRIAGVKMDIEGSEVPVLKSAREFLTRHRPNMVIEPHYVDGKFVADEVCQLLRSYGFAIEMLSQGAQNWPLIAAGFREAPSTYSVMNRPRLAEGA